MQNYRQVHLLFNANKTYDRQLIEGVGEYLQTKQRRWDVYIGEDFRYPLNRINLDRAHGIIADFDDIRVRNALKDASIPVVGVGGSYDNINDYPQNHYVATNNALIIKEAFNHLKNKGIKQFAFYGLPENTDLRWSYERELAFTQLLGKESYPYHIYHGIETNTDNWALAQQQLANWLINLPHQTGIIAVTDARARHILQVCERIELPIPEKLCVIGVDNEEITNYLSRILLSSVVQGAKKMGFEAAKILHKVLKNPQLPLQKVIVPPVGVISRQSTDFRTLEDPVIIQAIHFIRLNACKRIKVEQVLDTMGISRSNLEKKFKQELGMTIHDVIFTEKFSRAKNLLKNSQLTIQEIADVCGYPSIQYFYAIFKQELNMTPKAFRDEVKCSN